MSMFKTKKKTADRPAGGTTFLASAKAEHQKLFARFVAAADNYTSVEEYTDAIEAEAWSLLERVAKQSFKNGIARGRRTHRDAAR